jgi:5S rRNA maturation endonuclease (ribonuclease M5)
MKLADTLTTLYELGIDVTVKQPSSSGWITARCPFAPYSKMHKHGYDRNPSFGIKIDDTKKSAFKCLTCGEKGTLQKLAEKLEMLTLEDNSEIIENIKSRDKGILAGFKAAKWQDDKLQTFVKAKKEETAKTDMQNSVPALGHPYLAARGISYQTSVRLHLRFNKEENRIIFPIFDKDYKLVGTARRAINKNAPLKVKNSVGFQTTKYFLGEHTVTKFVPDDLKAIIVCEGLFDYAKYIEAGYSWVLACLTASLSEEKIQKLLDYNKPIIWAFDNDEAGRKLFYGYKDVTGKFVEGMKQILKNKLPQYIVEYPEGCKDAGDMSTAQIQSMIQNAKFVI